MENYFYYSSTKTCEMVLLNTQNKIHVLFKKIMTILQWKFPYLDLCGLLIGFCLSHRKAKKSINKGAHVNKLRIGADIETFTSG